MNDLLLFEKFDKHYKILASFLILQNLLILQNQRVRQFLINWMKIPAILVTYLPIVNISREPEFKRFLTPDKASVYKSLAPTREKPV